MLSPEVWIYEAAEQCVVCCLSLPIPGQQDLGRGKQDRLLMPYLCAEKASSDSELISG